MKRRGFSTIELLVVLAIVTVLAAILMAVMNHRREEERQRRARNCGPNLRQIGVAIKQYLSDYDEKFPMVSVHNAPYGWADAVQPYVRDTQLFQCGANDAMPGPADFDGSDPNYTDYFYNSRLAGHDESELQYIASTVILGDAVPGNARRHSTGGTVKSPGAIANLVDSSGEPIGAATRHLDGANYAFADGHVKWLKGSDANTTPAIRANASGSKNPTFSIQ